MRMNARRGSFNTSANRRCLESFINLVFLGQDRNHYTEIYPNLKYLRDLLSLGPIPRGHLYQEGGEAMDLAVLHLLPKCWLPLWLHLDKRWQTLCCFSEHSNLELTVEVIFFLSQIFTHTQFLSHFLKIGWNSIK